MPIFRWMYPKVSSGATWLIALVLPETQWYMAILRITRLLTAITDPFAVHTSRRAEGMLHFWLTHLYRNHRSFPIPIRTEGVEELIEARSNPHGMMLVSVHMSFSDLVLRPLYEMGCAPDATIARGTSLIDEKLPIGGMAEMVPAIPSESPLVLLKAGRILLRGGMVGALIDLGGKLNPNVLRLVGAVGARLVFYFPEMQKNGDILFRFLAPPDPFCKTPAGILSNMEYLRAIWNGTSWLTSQSGAERLLDAERPLHPAAQSSSQEVG